jgi:cold shock protein
MERGKVAWFSAQKGFGFIKRQQGADVFCHFSAIIGDGYRQLKEGQEVEFEIVKGEKGAQASQVRVIDERE